MILGAVVSHFLVPSVQRGGLWGGQSETLEALAVGRMGQESRYALTARRPSRGLASFCSPK